MTRRALGPAALVLAVVGGACGADDDTTVTAGRDEPSPTSRSTAGGDPAAGEAPSTLLARCASIEVSPALDGPLSADPDVAAAQIWRASMGLASDEAHVASVNSRPTGSFGFPLTDDEEALLLEREQTVVPEAIATFGTRYPETFGLFWLDNAAGGRFMMSFTEGVAERQAELDAELGAGAVQVVQVAYSQAELSALQNEVVAFLQGEGIAFSGVGSGSTLNRVSVGLSVVDDASVGALVERFGTDDRLCVEGADPADVIPAGPQPEGGVGWRLLADEPGVGSVYRTAVALDQESYTALWQEIGLTGDPPVVDLDRAIVVWFAPAVSGSCADIRLDDVIVDTDAGLVYPAIVLPGGDRTCTSDANPHAYVVALERSALPPEFAVQLGPEIICSGCEEAGESEATPVTLDP